MRKNALRSDRTWRFAEGESWKWVGPEMPVANWPIVNVHHQLEVRNLVLLLLLDGSQEKVLHALTPGWKQAIPRSVELAVDGLIGDGLAVLLTALPQQVSAEKILKGWFRNQAFLAFFFWEFLENLLKFFRDVQKRNG